MQKLPSGELGLGISFILPSLQAKFVLRRLFKYASPKGVKSPRAGQAEAAYKDYERKGSKAAITLVREEMIYMIIIGNDRGGSS